MSEFNNTNIVIAGYSNDIGEKLYELLIDKSSPKKIGLIINKNDILP